jgi:hypothetical protein
MTKDHLRTTTRLLAAGALGAGSLVASVAFGGVVGASLPAGTGFSATGASQTYVVPANVCHVTLDVEAAAGGQGGTQHRNTYGPSGGAAGSGGTGQGEATVFPGEILTVIVGSPGTAGTSNASGKSAGGFGGGGSSGEPLGVGSGGGGGGATAIMHGAVTLLEAGGGGGGGGSTIAANGGNGGNAGQSGTAGGTDYWTGAGGGAGATTTAGGAGGGAGSGNSGDAGAGYDGTAAQGGAGAGAGAPEPWNPVYAGGGGGGGYFGGGGGGNGSQNNGYGGGAAGGGGSGWADSSITGVTTWAGHTGTGSGSALITPDGGSCAAPNAPTSVSATGTGTSATVSFTEPTYNGTDILGYTVVAHDVTRPGDASNGTFVTGSASPITVSGLNPGDTYTYEVDAWNLAGTSPFSTASAGAQQGITMGLPTASSTTSSSITATWTPVTSLGVATYTVSAVNQVTSATTTCTSKGSSCTLKHLTAGTSYEITVVAAIKFKVAGQPQWTIYSPTQDPGVVASTT